MRLRQQRRSSGFFFTNVLFVFLIGLYQLRVIKTPQLFGATNTQRHAQSPPSQRAGDIVNARPLRRKTEYLAEVASPGWTAERMHVEPRWMDCKFLFIYYQLQVLTWTTALLNNLWWSVGKQYFTFVVNAHRNGELNCRSALGSLQARWTSIIVITIELGPGKNPASEDIFRISSYHGGALPAQPWLPWGSWCRMPRVVGMERF